MTDAEQQYQLTQEQIDFFLENGWLKLSNCFTKQQADDLQSTLWTRLGMDPNDKSTWHTERINMPHWKEFQVADFAPRAWGGICGLLGGSHKIDIDSEVSLWKDSFIVNLGTPQKHNKLVKPQDLDNWHVDGDFFVHYLDSPEQALLVIPLWTDIVPGGGGTMICPAAISHIAKHLYENPEGVTPRMTPRRDYNEAVPEQGLTWYIDLAKTMSDESFVEVTGVVGDVFLLHPMMLHSASNNMLRKVRVITNPPVSVKDPFVFDREDGNYSVVERKTLRALGKDKLKGWKITAERQRIVPERVKVQERMKTEEEGRLRKLRENGTSVDGAKQVPTSA
ncbi:hypothetical protein C7974DRAFT_355486 [Boeremia exigua]|uniref:uncharacterized protein n=1 Tax=Boeremia exigua TaxID=749465 RepID=UPI001E8D5B07|nr:uncharacterized protein C7974DRAFT_355486 [Boeremia exigua]KAH6637702.1 hypothetical protein C7974DRAFT_355486 [Boeremia exigua]